MGVSLLFMDISKTRNTWWGDEGGIKADSMPKLRCKQMRWLKKEREDKKRAVVLFILLYYSSSTLHRFFFFLKYELTFTKKVQCLLMHMK